MAKMYYTEDEAAEKLSKERLDELVQNGELQAYQDGPRRMYKAADVDAIAGDSEQDDIGEIELTPADTGTGDAISLSEADESTGSTNTKEDTVITAEGISIFDDEDLEIEADPMAKTQIAPSIEDQISLEGVGSGSGLLDLTRESDDTSLGAEVLDHIDMESAVGEDISEELGGPEPVGAYPQPEPVVAQGPRVVEAVDTTAGLFGGMAVGVAIIAVLYALASMAIMLGNQPDFLVAMKNNIVFVLVGAFIVLVICAVIGLLIGMSAANRKRAMRTMGA
ncbi:MAG: hypothetical protein ACLFVU_02655 [Phycisphaerae bacterium]